MAYNPVCLADAAAEGIVGERHFLAVGTDDAGEYAVALPVVSPARTEGAEADAKLGFEPLLINRATMSPRNAITYL